MTDTPTKGALVTGASDGIGDAIAKRLARDGFAVLANYAGETKLMDPGTLEELNPYEFFDTACLYLGRPCGRLGAIAAAQRPVPRTDREAVATDTTQEEAMRARNPSPRSPRPPRSRDARR